MNVYGQLFRAQLENLASDPSSAATLAGRVFYNTTSARLKFDTGSAIGYLLSDQGLVDNYLDFSHISSPSNPASATTRLFMKTNDKLFLRANAGTEYQVATLTGTESFTNKTISDSITFAQISTPSAPASGFLKLYVKSDNNVYVQTSAGTETQLASNADSETRRNYLYNANFQYNQRLESGSTTAANTATAFGPDRWYCKNVLGTNGILTITTASPTNPQAIKACRVTITTAPTAAQTNGCELYQTLDNVSSLDFYNKNASFSIQVKARGNVNSIGAQLFYATTETKVTTAIGSEVTVAATTGAFATLSITAQAVGTSMTTSGVIGVRIRIAGVSSGNTYDLNNGFDVELPILAVGDTVPNFTTRFRNSALELLALQSFYEKSYDNGTAVGATTNNGCAAYIRSGSNSAGTVFFKSKKRGTPTIAVYSTNTGTVAKVYDVIAATDQNSSVTGTGQCAFTQIGGLGADGNYATFHYTADSEI